jgi:hypothetical protein
MPDGRTEGKERFRAPACAGEAHGRCPHLFSIGGFSLRRLRPLPGTLMCRCSCHVTCPVSHAAERGPVPARVWHSSCTCPGAERARRRVDEAGPELLDSGELRERVRRDSEARHQALRAARDRAAGLSREELREIYMAELRSRGLPMPSEPALNAAVERMMGNALPMARLMGEGMIETGKLLHGIFRIFRQTTRR